MEAYSWPTLDPESITQCLAELNITMDPQELLKPSPEKVRLIYEVLLEFLTGVSKEDLEQPNLEAQDALEYPDLHFDSIPEVAFVKALSKLMHNVGVHDFNLKLDLYIPTSQRIIRNLSAIINFAKFREDRLAQYMEHTNEAERLEEQKNQTIQQQRERENQLQILKMQHAAEEPIVNQLEEEAQKGAEIVVQLNKQQFVLQNESKAMKSQLNELLNKTKQEAQELNCLKHEVEKMKSLIVPSPEKAKKMLEEMSAAVENEKAIASESEKRGRELQAKYDKLSRLTKSLMVASNLIRECNDEKGRSKKFASEIEATQASCSQLEQKVQEAETNIQHVKRQVESTSEKAKRRQTQHREKIQAADEELQKLKEERRVAERENNTCIQQAALHEGARSAASRRMEQMTREHEAEMKALRAQLSSLEAQVLRYHRNLIAGLIAVDPSSQPIIA